MIKTLADIIKSNEYEFHHAAWHSGYVSRKLNDLDCKAVKYSGHFGNGYIVDIPSMESSRFCIRQYWIVKEN